MNKFEIAPQWVSEYLEGLTQIDSNREQKALEARFKGLSRVFEDVLETLPRQSSSRLNEFPVAAGIAIKATDGTLRLVSLAMNQTNTLQDSTAHAELAAIREAQSLLNNKHLKDCVLLTTLEPCVMCCGAVVNTAVSTVVFGANHEDVKNKHVLIEGEYKRWRVSPESFDSKTYLTTSGIEVVSGFLRDEVILAMKRGSYDFHQYYNDPDTE